MPRLPETVYVVLHANYGDQGVDFKGVFATREAADRFITQSEPVKDERRWYHVEEVLVQN